MSLLQPSGTDNTGVPSYPYRVLGKFSGFKTKGTSQGKMDEGDRPTVGGRSSMPL